MLTIRRSLHLTALCATVLAFAPACGGDDESPDTGTSTGMDAGIADRVMVFSDASTAVDAGFADASAPRDAGHYCTSNGQVDVNGAAVQVGEATGTPSVESGAAAILSCIDEPFSRTLTGQVTIRSCIQFIGGTPTPEEAAQLDVALFLAEDQMGVAIDPTFTASTGADRQPSGRINADVVIDTNSVTCPSGVEVEIGRQATGGDTPRISVEYTIRLSSSSSAAAALWATTYHPGSIVIQDAIRGGSPSSCTPQDCTGFINVIAVRASAVAEFAASAGVALQGADDLTDSVGDGYAIVSASDCNRLPMAGAVAGFSPSPSASGYLEANAYSTSATATDLSGVLVGLGFSNTTLDAPVAINAGVGIIRNEGACTEQFGGGQFRVYPDAFTVIRSGRSLILNP